MDKLYSIADRWFFFVSFVFATVDVVDYGVAIYTGLWIIGERVLHMHEYAGWLS